jgi:hypothetical protein
MNAEDFRERCRQAGIADDKPLSQILMTVFVASETALSTVKTGARGLTPEGEAELVGRLVKTVDVAVKSSAQQNRLRLERKASWVAGGVVAASLLLGGSGGYAWGWSTARQSVASTEQGIALAFRHGPDAAATWHQLMQNNDPRQALTQCGGSAWSTGGRRACLVPLWLDGPGEPPAKK